MQNSDPNFLPEKENRWHILANDAYSVLEHPWATGAEQFEAAQASVSKARTLFPEPHNPVGKDKEFGIAMFIKAMGKALSLVDPNTIDGAVIVYESEEAFIDAGEDNFSAEELENLDGK